MEDVGSTNLLLLDTNVNVNVTRFTVMVEHRSVNLKRNMGVMDVKKKNVVQEIVKDIRYLTICSNVYKTFIAS